MKQPLRLRRAIVLLCCVALLVQARPARASITSDVVWVFVAVAATGAALGVGVYYLVRKGPTVTGCVATGQNGSLELTEESTQKVYRLLGDLANIQPGERVRASGKRSKTSTGIAQFLVEKPAKDYGPCKLVHP